MAKLDFYNVEEESERRKKDLFIMFDCNSTSADL